MRWKRVGALVCVVVVGCAGVTACRPLLQVDEPEGGTPLAESDTTGQAATPEAAPPAASDGAGPVLGKPRPNLAWPPMVPMVPPLPPPMVLPPMPPGPGFPPPGPGLAMPLPPGAPGGMPTPGFGAPGLPLDPSARPTVTDVAYGADARQRLDLYLPERTTEAAPILLFVHGGAWSSGDKADYAWLGAQLARAGLVVAVANYRLSPAVQHPAHAQDVAAAVGWLYRYGAAHGGDPQRLYLAGHSAGAHLVSLVALDPTYLEAVGVPATAIAGVAGFAGAAYDLDARYVSTPLASLFAPAFGSDPARWADAAPLRYVKPGAPPFLLVHGLADNQAPATSAQAFAAALQRDGVPTTLQLLPGQDHFSALLSGVASVRSFVQEAKGRPGEVRKPGPRDDAGRPRPRGI